MRSFVSATALATAMAVGQSVVVAPHAGAQEADLSGVIRAIQVEGNQRIEARTVQSYLLLEPGDPFDTERIDLSLKTLFATGLFADVTIDKRGQDLIVRVVENPIINRVIFEGNRALDDDKLREEIEAAPRGIFTAARVQSDVQRVLELYRQAGRFSANVEPEYKPLEQNRVDLIFKITEGPVTGVRSINFIGNDAYSDRRLRSEIATKQSRLWRFFSSNDNYDPGRLEFDREQLRQFYQNNGYYDFTVISAVADLTPDREDFYITFTIDEGEQYNFGEIRVETALEKLNGDVLAGAVPTRTGELYRGDLIEDAIDTLTYAAGIAGYAFVDIRPRIQADPETNTVNVIYAIDEGPRVYIERVNIIGNTQTLDRVIRRELRISEGDAFNRVLLDRSRNRVRALGYFKEVEITEKAGSEPDRTVVDIKVEEQPTGELSFAAGFSSVDAFLIDLSVSQRNLRGRGQSAIARISASDRQQVVDLRFTEPRFLDRNLAAGIELFATRSDFLDVSNFETETIGAGVRLSFPLSERTNLGLRYRLQSDQISVEDIPVLIDTTTGLQYIEEVTDDNGTPDDPDDDTTFLQVLPPETDPVPENGLVVDQCDPQFLGRSSLCSSERNDLSSILGYSFFWDRRNDPIEPTRGFDMNISQDIAGLGGDVNFLRTEASAAWYRGIWRDVRFSTRVSAGHITPFADDDSVRINNRFFRGGSTFRGFDVAGLGPRIIEKTFDSEGNEIGLQRGNAQGGNVYYQATAELTVPNFLPEEYGIRSALFTELGSLGTLEDADIDPTFFRSDPITGNQIVQYTEDELTLRASAGISVFWDSPFGPIRFDFSQILRKEDYDRTETFRFSTSTQF